MARRHASDQLTASPTSSHKRDPCTTSLRLARPPPAPTGAWAITRGASPRREHFHCDVWRNDSPRHADTPAGGHASSRPLQEPECGSVRPRSHPINIIANSTTRKLSSRHSSTPYDELKPRLRPKRGGLVKYSGKPGQQETIRRRCQASRVNNHARPRGGSHDQVARLHFNAS
jgi:hypothetical protein